jgi:hypothetical protein
MLTSLVLVCGRTRSRSKKSPVPKKRTRCRRVLGFSKNSPLFLDSVLALEHIVNLGKVVGTRGDGRGVALRSVALLEMGLLSEVAHLVVGLRGHSTASLEAGGNAENVGDLLNAAVDTERHETGSKTRSVAEETNSLALKSLVVDDTDKTGQTTPDTATVHVTAVGGDLDGRVDTLLEALLGESHEGLLNDLVGQGLLIIHITELRSNLSERRRVSVGEVVVVEETSIRLLDKLASRRVESKVVESVEAGLGRVITVCGAIGAIGQLGLTLAVGAVGGIEGHGVAVERVVTINVGVLAGKVGLVEIVGVLHVGTTQTGLSNDRGVGADQESDSSSTTSGASIALGVESNITGNDDSIATVPSGRLNPVDGVENSVGTTVASVDSVDTLDVGVVTKQLHKHTLDRLGLVEEGLGANLEVTNGVGVDVVVLEELRCSGKGERVDVLTIVAEAHLGLAKTNGVLSGANAIELLELNLINILAGEVKLNGLDANVLRTGRHDDRLGGRYRLVGEEEEEDKEKRWEEKLRKRKRMWR